MKRKYTSQIKSQNGRKCKPKGSKLRRKAPGIKSNGEVDGRLGKAPTKPFKKGAEHHASRENRKRQLIEGPKPFTKGWRPPQVGRKGKPSKITVILKEAVLIAAEEIGYDGEGGEGLLGYLKMIAWTQPKSFTALLGRILPLQITTAPPDETAPETMSRADLRKRALERGLPAAIFDAAMPPIGNEDEVVDVVERAETDQLEHDIVRGEGEQE